MGKTTTKTDAVEPVTEQVPVATRATGVPGINEVPSAHTN